MCQRALGGSEKLVPAGFIVSRHFTGLRSHRSLARGPGQVSVPALHLIAPTEDSVATETVTQKHVETFYTTQNPGTL